MTEHDKLREIFTKIEYRNDNYLIDEEFWLCKEIYWTWLECDVREIIFTEDFREHLYDYLLLSVEEHKIKRIIEEIMWHLQNPVEYIYKLIK